MDECHQNVSKVFVLFGSIIRIVATYFLEVGEPFSLKVAFKGSIRGKDNLES